MGYLYYMDVIINENQLRFLIEGRIGYTKDGIRDTAKKYNNYKDFQVNAKGEYNAARRFGPCYDKNENEVKCYITGEDGGGWTKNPESKRNSLKFLKDISSHMEKSFLTKDKIRDTAKKYDDYTEFRRKEGGLYNAARRFGPCYDKNENEVKCYITREDGRGWTKNPDNVRNSLEFFNEITSGMTRADFGPKLVYSYTFFDDKNEVVGVYVGITNDEERRKGEHLTGESTFTDKEVKSAVGNFIKENPTFKAEYTKLTEYIPFVDAQVKEEEYVNNAKSNGYNILNIAKTGSGGASFGFPDKYLIDKVNDWIKTKKEKGEEPLLKDFTEKYKNTIYSAIGKRKRKGNQKLYDETIGKLIRKSKPKIQQMFADRLNTSDQTTPETTPSV